MSFGMMIMVLFTSNHPKLARYTGLIAGVMVTCYLILSAPISGFSINPARTIASALPAMRFDAFWIYMTAPFIGMSTAAELYLLLGRKAMCAKFHHSELYTCIFNCGYCKHTEASQNTTRSEPIL
jgi:aquaporin Z